MNQEDLFDKWYKEYKRHDSDIYSIAKDAWMASYESIGNILLQSIIKKDKDNGEKG